MCHRSGTLFALVAILAWGYLSSSAVHGADPDQIDLSTIARRLAEWRASFANLRVVYELRSLPEAEKPVVEWSVPPDPESAPLFARNEWIWADHGLDLLESRSFYWTPGAVGIRSIDVFNGPKNLSFRASYRTPSEGAEEFKELSLSGLGIGKPISWKSRTPVDGLYWPRGATWLPEILANWRWKLEKIEDVHGEPCARITATQPEVADGVFVEILWLDLKHDFLVRRHLSPLAPKRRLGSDFIVDEFQQLETGIWFPKRGRLQMYSDSNESKLHQLFVVTEAEVNQSLDLARFNPPPPAVGTIVNDGHGKVYTHGGSAAPLERTPKASEVGQSTSSAPAATPPTSSWLWWSGALICVSFTFLVMGFWFWKRK